MANRAVSPENPDSPYHILLTDGKDSVGLVCIPDADAIGRNPVEVSSLKTSSGNQKYSDLQPPYMTIAQDDWTGGRAASEYESDVTRYADGLRMNTERSTGVMLAGRETYATGMRSDLRSLPGSMKLIALTDSRRCLTVRKVADVTFSGMQIWFWVRRKGTPKGDLTVRLRADDAGNPHTVLQSVTLEADDLEKLISHLYIFTITAESITSGTAYWVEIVGASGDTDDNHWEVGVKEETGTTKRSSDGTTYASADVDLYYRVTTTDSGEEGHLFEYKKSFYYVSKPGDGTAAVLQINGARGLGASNAGQLDKLVCSAAHGLSANEAVGCVVMVIDGKGSTEAQNWRTVTANGLSNFTVDADWEIEHDATTVWVLLGLDKWTTIGSTGLTKPVTDVWVSSAEFVYFCQGEDAVMIRMKEEVSGGAWVRTFDAETTKAVFLTEYNNGGTQYMVRTNGETTASEVATPTSWADFGAWGTSKAVGKKYDRITGVEPYKDYNLNDAVVVFKEAGPWQWKDEVVDKMRVPEMSAIESYKNGRASCVQGSYLFFSMQNSIYRFYTPNFDDIGPVNDEGLPTGRQGPVVAFVAYPGRIIIAVDAGPDGYSAVFSGSGGSTWHEIYRAPLGQRIRAMGFQVVPGPLPDRLWLLQGADIVWLPYPSETYDPYQDDEYPFAHEGVLEFANMTAGLYDAWKYWKALKLRTENLSEGERWMEADYRLSEDDDWEEFPDAFDISPVQEQEFDDDFGIAGQVLYLRLRMYSTSTAASPKLKAAAISGVTVTQPKFSYQVTVQARLKDLNSQKEQSEPYRKVRMLDDWCGQARPLKLYCTNPLFHDVKVFLQPLPTRPLASAEKVGEWEYQFAIVLQEA